VGMTFVFLLLFVGQRTVVVLFVPSCWFRGRKKVGTANVQCGNSAPTIFSAKKKKAKAVLGRKKTVLWDTSP